MTKAESQVHNEGGQQASFRYLADKHDRDL